MLTIDQIRALHGSGETLIPAWGGEIKIRRLTAAQYLSLDFDNDDPDKRIDYLASVIQMCAVNEDGSPLFDDSTRRILIEDPVETLRIGMDVLRFNKIIGAKKNSPTIPSESSPTDSAAN